MFPRTTFFMSTHGQAPGFHAFTVANDDHPDRPAAAASGLRLVEGERRLAGGDAR